MGKMVFFCLWINEMEGNLFMIKVKKIINRALIFALSGIFLFLSFTYAADFSSLRVPFEKRDRIETALREISSKKMVRGIEGIASKDAVFEHITEEKIYLLYLSVADRFNIAAKPGELEALIGHIIRTSRLSKLLLRRLGMDKNSIRDAEVAALLHDLGKLADNRIFFLTNTPRKLTDEEFLIVRKHALLTICWRA